MEREKRTRYKPKRWVIHERKEASLRPTDSSAVVETPSECPAAAVSTKVSPSLGRLPHAPVVSST